MGFRSAVATRLVAAAVVEIAVHKQNLLEAVEPSAVHPKGSMAAAMSCSGTAFVAGCTAVVLELAEKLADSGSSARSAAGQVGPAPGPRMGSSFLLVAQHSLIVAETLFEAEAP